MHMEKKNIVIAVLSMLLVALGGLLVYLAFSGKGTSTTSVPEESWQRALPIPTNEDAVASVPGSQAPVASSETKRYENGKYGFAIDIPRDFWYEENEHEYPGEGPESSATLTFSLGIQNPALEPEPIATFDGTTHTPKYGTFFTVGVHDKSGGIAPPNGLDYAKTTPVTVGGLSGTRYDDRSYSLLGKSFVYSIDRYVSENGVTETPEMKKVFEDIVKTFKFE